MDGPTSNGGYGGPSIRINLGRYTIDTRIIAERDRYTTREPRTLQVFGYPLGLVWNQS
jgi:hypothetical protein